MHPAFKLFWNAEVLFRITIPHRQVFDAHRVGYGGGYSSDPDAQYKCKQTGPAKKSSTSMEQVQPNQESSLKLGKIPTKKVNVPSRVCHTFTFFAAT